MTPGGSRVVVIPGPPPLLPPLPPPPLVASAGDRAAGHRLPSGVRPFPEEVPLIPETESLWLILAGMVAAAGIALLRRRYGAPGGPGPCSDAGSGLGRIYSEFRSD